MFEWLIFMLGLVGGCIGTYFIVRKRLTENIEQNTKIANQNAEAEQKNFELKLTEQVYREEIDKAKRELELTEFELDKKKIELVGIKENISNLRDQAAESAEVFYETSKALAEEKLDRSLTQKGLEVQQACEKYEEDYAKLLEDCVNDFVSKTAEYQTQYRDLEILLADLRARVEAAVEANRREEEKETAKDFYKLNLTERDIKEITKLRSIIPELRDPEPLNKIIWKVYYEKPYTDLVGRVVGQGVKTGIYKITNIQNEKCYVGQAANIADRWRQHIKRGVGAEAPTRNKLYPAMLSIGVENFRFEVIEECDRSKLNEREDYWQDYFHAKDYGYSIK